MLCYSNASIADYNAVYSADYSTESKRPSITISYQLPAGAINGINYIKYGTLYLTVNNGMIEGRTLTLQSLKSAGPARLRQMWRVEYAAPNYYTIRSVYRPDLALNVTDGVVDVAYLSTSVSSASTPANRRWMITQSSTGHLLSHMGSSSKTMYPQGASPGVNVVAGTSTAVWSFEPTTVSNQVLLINTTNGLPATNAVRYITPGETRSPSSFNFMAVHIRPNSYAQSIIWDSLTPSAAKINMDTGYVTSVWEGSSTITATAYGSTNTVSYTLKVLPIPEGTYFIRNREYGEHLQVEDTDYANNFSTSGAIMEIWPHNGEAYQKWTFNSLGNGYYSIVNYHSGLALSVPAGQTGTADVSLVQEAYNGYDRQKWKITQTDYYCYKLMPKSAEGANNDLVIAVGDYPADEYYNVNVEQRTYVDDNEYQDEWWICSFVDIGMSTDDYTGAKGRERGSYHYANTFYDEFLKSSLLPMSLTHHYNKETSHTANKTDFAVHGAISDDIDFMIYIGHGHSVDTGADNRYNDRKLNHIQYSVSTMGEINSSSMCTKSYTQEYKDRFCLYTDEVHFGSDNSDLRWVWMYTCNFLHAREDNGDPDGTSVNDNEFVSNAMLAEMMTGAHIVMGYASASLLCADVASDFGTSLREGIPLYDAFFLYGYNSERFHAKDNHHQKIMYIDQTRHETIYSPQIHYDYDIQDVRFVKHAIHTKYTYIEYNPEV